MNAVTILVLGAGMIAVCLIALRIAKMNEKERSRVGEVDSR